MMVLSEARSGPRVVAPVEERQVMLFIEDVNGRFIRTMVPARELEAAEPVLFSNIVLAWGLRL